jgi:tetratricopeptide (TPR) repeat protein
MYEAVGNLGSVVAYSAFDIANYDAADRCFAFTLWCAEQAGSWALRANTLAEMARKAEYLRDYELALTQIEFAQVRADRLSPAARAMLWTLRARMLAMTDRTAEALDDVKRADDYFADVDPANEPPWLCYYDAAEHQGSTGKALIPVAEATKQLEIAMPRLAYAVQSQRKTYPRSRAFSRTRLASLIMSVGDPREAVVIGREAYAEARPLQSTRIVKELRHLAKVSGRYARIGEVADLAHDITTMAPKAAEPS